MEGSRYVEVEAGILNFFFFFFFDGRGFFSTQTRPGRRLSWRSGSEGRENPRDEGASRQRDRGGRKGGKFELCKKVIDAAAFQISSLDMLSLTCCRL